MRLTNIGKTLLLGGALAFASACGGDDTHTTTDAGHDSGTPQDSGTDSGFDAGMDAGPQMPAHLRIAHLAWGTGVGNVHLCAKSSGPTPDWLLVTSDALATGNFTGATVATPLRAGSISKHFDVPASVTGILGGRSIEVYSAANANATVQGGIGSCAPTGQPLAAATLGGGGAGAINLVPGGYATVAIVGANGGAETMTCPDGLGGTQACPGVSIVTLTDSVAPGASGQAKVRIVNGDARFGAPGICEDIAGNPLPNPTAIVPVVNPYLMTAAPLYYDIAPIAAPSDGDGGVLTLAMTIHPLGSGTTSATLCLATQARTFGTIPNNGLAAQYAANAAAGAATVRTTLPADKVTSLFVAPIMLQFRDLTGSGGTCAGGAGGPASCPTCDPTMNSPQTCIPYDPCNAPSTSCLVIPVGIPVADGPI